jgi:hypothetical protein
MEMIRFSWMAYGFAQPRIILQGVDIPVVIGLIGLDEVHLPAMLLKDGPGTHIPS